MNLNSIESRIEYSQDIPGAIEAGLLSLFDVESLDRLSSREKVLLRESIQKLFWSTSATDYSGYCRAYALYYLPVNLYKIWRPLLDLSLTDSLPTQGKVLELGAGPGSATFGLIEYYRYLAAGNDLLSFCLDICIIEKNPEFISVFEKLYSTYIKNLPENLSLSVKCIRNDAFDYLSNSCAESFDLIIESNMLNPNEGISESHLTQFATGLIPLMSKHSSAILIEPAKKELAETLNSVTKHLLCLGLGRYSPCCCSSAECYQFASGRIDTSGIKLTKLLFDRGIITRQPSTHSFEYAVFRNDAMQKYDYNGSGSLLSDLRDRIGEIISFKAFVLTAIDNIDHFSIKICDGSRSRSGDLWLEVPKNILVEKQLNCLTAGRGGLVDVRDAVVVHSAKIGVTQKTRLKIYM